MSPGRALASGLLVLFASCASRGEATSLLGRRLEPLPLSPERRAELTADLRAAAREHRAHPESEEAAIWHGRRLAYLGRYRDAIAVYGAALERFPNSTKLLRHRGHRYITVRDFPAAERDLTLAAEWTRGLDDEIEPDGAPNALGIPRSTHQSNVTYHLGLARFLQGDFLGALAAYRRGLDLSRVNDDMLCATSTWLVYTLKRLGRHDEARSVLAAIHPDLDVIENHAYHRLLLAYRDGSEESLEALLVDLQPTSTEFATTAFGVGHEYLVRGDRERARSLFRRILDAGAWPAFGHIAAEAELARP